MNVHSPFRTALKHLGLKHLGQHCKFSNEVHRKLSEVLGQQGSRIHSKRSSICRVNTAVVTVGDLQRVYIHPAEPRDHVQIEKLCLQAGMVVGDLSVKTTPLVARPYREQCSMVGR